VRNADVRAGALGRRRTRNALATLLIDDRRRRRRNRPAEEHERRVGRVAHDDHVADERVERGRAERKRLAERRVDRPERVAVLRGGAAAERRLVAVGVDHDRDEGAAGRDVRHAHREAIAVGATHRDDLAGHVGVVGARGTRERARVGAVRAERAERERCEREERGRPTIEHAHGRTSERGRGGPRPTA